MSGSLLSRYRLLSPLAGVRVSPLCFGAMGLGANSAAFMNGKVCTEAESFALLDAYYAEGGNFIDTANTYQSGASERIIGAWCKARSEGALLEEGEGRRNEMVIATKFTCSSIDRTSQTKPTIQTTYIDILYIHNWDFSTGVAEIMKALDILVKAGKVLYLGISDTPAWVVVKANAYARQHGMTPFAVYQGLWSLHNRDIEREILPMCLDEGMAVLSWGSLGQGKYKSASKINNEVLKNSRGGPQSEKEKAVAAILEEMSQEMGLGEEGMTQIALAYVLQKQPYVFPIVGGTSIPQLKGNVGALRIKLNEDQINRLEAAVPFELGFPYVCAQVPSQQPFGFIPIFTQGAGIVDSVRGPFAIASPEL